MNEENLNRPITAQQIEAVIKKLPTHKSPEPDGFTKNFTKHLRANLYPLQTISKNSRRRKTPKLVLQSQHHPNPKTR